MTASLDNRPAENDKLDSLVSALAQRVQSANSDRVRTITNAMTGKSLGHVPHCTPDDVAAAARRALPCSTSGPGGQYASGRASCCASTIWC
jgi:hypothetical protein